MSPRVLFASLLALACLLYSPPASAQLPASLTDVQIISVSGCVDVGAVTVNCSVATTTLLIRTAAGFPATTNWVSRPVYVAARLNDYAYFVTTAPWLNTADPSNSSVYVNVTAGGYFPQLTGQFLSVSFVPSPSATRPGSAAFAGFSYAFDGPPTLLSISGCDGSGAATLHCVPGSSLLELTGSGLLWLQSSIRTTVNIGSVSDTLYGGVQVLNDSYATLSLAGLYSRLLQPQHYAGVLLSFNLTSTTYNRQGVVQHSYTTNALQLSFVPLPPPKVKDWYATTQHATSLLKPRQPPAFALNASVRCLSTKCMCFRVITTCDDASGAPSTWRGCRPGYDVQATVGGVVCPIYAPYSFFIDASILVCTLPAFDYNPSTAYDLVLSNAAGVNVSLSAQVQYTSAPTLSSIAPCIDRGEWYAAWGDGAQCSAGTTITLRGSRFPTTGVVSVQYSVPGASSVPITLLSPTVLNSTAVTATLPDAAAAYGSGGDLVVRFINGSVTNSTNTLMNTLYLWYDAPTITSVSSDMCDSLSPLQLANCRALAAITVTGSHFNGHFRLTYTTTVGAHSVGDLGEGGLLSSPVATDTTWYSALSDTSLVLTLDYFDADTNALLLPDVVFTLYLSVADVGRQPAYSNAFRISLSYGDDAIPPDSPSKLSTGAIAGIVVAAAMGALLLAVAAVWLVQRQLLRKSARREQQWTEQGRGQSSSDEWRHVELQ